MPAKKKVSKKIVKRTKPKTKITKKPSPKTKKAAPSIRIVGPTTHIAPVGRKVGTIAHFYPKISVAVVNVTAPIKQGSEVVIRGGSTNFKQRVESMQIEHTKIAEAKPGQSIGMRVNEHVREGDEVYLAA